MPSINVSNIKRKIIGNPENCSRGCWVGSKYATSVPCHAAPMTKACLFLLQADPLAAAAPAETSDDILAKYRKRTAAATNDEDLIDLSNSNEVILHEGNRSQVRSFFISSLEGLVIEVF